MFYIHLKQTFVMVIIFSGIPLLAMSVIGLIVSMLQAMTQIQEQTITYAAKFIVLSVTLVLLAPWFQHEMVEFLTQMLASVRFIGAE